MKRTLANLDALHARLRAAADELRACLTLADGVIPGAEQGLLFEAYERALTVQARVHRTIGEIRDGAADPVALPDAV